MVSHVYRSCIHPEGHGDRFLCGGEQESDQLIGNTLEQQKFKKKAHWVTSSCKDHKSYPEVRDKYLRTSHLKEVKS
ncbi:hypothetical protein E2C01_026939 [Portunus trituberculatus]|uniref:Uncharacterized protein n=1 Tax=Portunus trituberculatus TaxID=210409 RepID=A0A5B7EJJ5_PORTR|nr:hypothetical protein [Portunus trituberculatus]